MRDRLVLPILVLIGLVMIALSLVWPQGLGRRSPAPFGHAPAAAGHTSPIVAPAPVSHHGDRSKTSGDPRY